MRDLPRSRVYGSRTLLALGCVLALVSCFSLWAKRQLLDTDHWVDTSSALLRDDAIQTATSQYLADQLFNGPAVTATLQQKLPPRLQPFAGQAAAGLSELTARVSKRLIASSEFQTLWRQANKATHKQFVNLIEGKSTTVSGNNVVLDLRPAIGKLAQRIGLPPDTVNKLPPDAGHVVIMKSDQLKTLQDLTDLLNTIAWVATGLMIAAFAGAVALVPGRRRRTLLYCGVGFIVVGLFVLALRRIVGGQVVDALAGQGASKPAAESTWRIGTSLLVGIAQAGIVLGLLLVAAAWLAGPARWAVAARKWMAPTLIEHPGIAWAVAAAALLILIAWGPFEAARTALGALFFGVMIAAGLVVLTRQVREEFPRTS
jgi:hypothetical protein